MITASTLQFLKDISQNNNREWFQKHKDQYHESRNNALEFTREIIRGLTKFDEAIPADLNPEDCLMRIYRDIRFSKDKTPYKTNLGIAISASGKNFNGPGYYLHIQPGNSFVAGGSWYPEKEQLNAIRQEIDYNASDFLSILNAPEFVEYFSELDREAKLRTAPKGYPSDHELIEHLKLKSFVASRSFGDNLLLQKDAVSKIVDTFEKLHPLMVFLRTAIS